MYDKIPLVSIVIPAYNHEKYIEVAVMSAINQDYPNTELLLLNDGSTDSTGNICENIASRFRKIRYFSHENMGAHNSINKGIDAAHGKYIAVLNSDDIFFPTKLQRCIEITNKNQNIQFISGNLIFINADGNEEKNGEAVKWRERALLFYKETNLFELSVMNENFITTTSNMFFSKDIWIRAGGFQNLRYCHDLEFLISANRNGECFYDESELHIAYRVHQENTIKENFSKVRMELASVIASSFVLDNINILGDIEANTVVFISRFLKNKAISNMIILMLMYYLKLGDRKVFFDNLSSDSMKIKFSNLIE